MKHSLNTIWLKAAVAGGLWASFEIIAGSMLHNLHLPFSGTILATFSVILMIAFLQIWKINGLILRAGIICGLMKSLSPSAVILGPMTGIMLEAMVMDLLILLAGRHLFGYIIAGIGALLSAILHKLASLFILYGTDLVTIYANLFEFLKRQLNLTDATPKGLITGIIGVYILLGTLAALSGYLLGRHALRRPEAGTDFKPEIDPYQSAWNKTDPDHPYRTVLLLLHTVMIPSMLLLINRFGLSPASLVPAGIYLAFLLIYYKRILGRLMKPLFWSQLLIMTLFASLFWHPPEGTSYRTDSGFLIGLEMSLRAIMIVSTFSALSVEIRNPRITESLLKLGLGNAYAAVSLSFNSLPVMLDRSANLKTFIRNPVRSFSRIIVEAQLWLNRYQAHLEK
ncbi:MAG: hypothetical protein ABFS10_02120 [Bacteroidota bacterium]